MSKTQSDAATTAENHAHHAWCQQFRPTCCDRGPIGGVCDDGCACLPCRASFAAAQSERDGHRGYGETVRHLRTENDGLRNKLRAIRNWCDIQDDTPPIQALVEIERLCEAAAALTPPAGTEGGAS